MNPNAISKEELERLKSILDIAIKWQGEKADMLAPMIGEMAEQLRDIEA